MFLPSSLVSVPTVVVNWLFPPFMLMFPLFIPRCLESALLRFLDDWGVGIPSTLGAYNSGSGAVSRSVIVPVAILIPMLLLLYLLYLSGVSAELSDCRLISPSDTKVSLNVVCKNIPEFPCPETNILPPAKFFTTFSPALIGLGVGLPTIVLYWVVTVSQCLTFPVWRGSSITAIPAELPFPASPPLPESGVRGLAALTGMLEATSLYPETYILPLFVTEECSVFIPDDTFIP